MKLRHILLLLLIGSTLPSLWGQEFRFMLEDELSSKRISDIYQDSDGFMWIATDNGLNRFDGNKVTIYNNEENNPRSLYDNLSTAVIEGKDGNLYVGSYRGVQLYDKRTNDFPCRAILPDGLPFNATVSGFCQLPNGTLCAYGDDIWSITWRDSLLTIDKLGWEVKDRRATRIVCDKENYVWLLTQIGELYRIKNSQEQQLNPWPMPGTLFRDIFLAGGNLYAVSEQNDIYCLDKETDQFEKVNTELISLAQIRDVGMYRGNLLMAFTDGNGLKIINPATGNVSDFDLNIPQLTSKHLKIHKAFFDKEGNFWIALYQKGVAMVSTQTSDFGYYGYKSLLYNNVGNCSISGLTKDSEGYLWVGTDGDGIYRVNPNGRRSRHFKSFLDDGATPPIIKCLYADSEDNVWVGTYGNGLGCIPRGADEYVPMQSLLKRGEYTAERVYDVVEDNQHRLWIATLDAGLFCYDLKRRHLIESMSYTSEINHCQTSLQYASSNKLYIGTFDGIYCINLNESEPKPRHLVKRSAVNTLFEDSRGIIWAGDNNGLYSIANDGTCTYYSNRQGLPSTSINSINEGEDHTLWLATCRGLIKYDPSLHVSTRYTTTEGVQCTEFSMMHSITDENGYLWFAGDYGITYFHPEHLSANKQMRHVRVLDFYVNNRRITTATRSEGEPIIHDPVFRSDTFNLASNDNSFFIEFGTLDLDTPPFAEYHYSVNGGEWQRANDRYHVAKFYNLDPGIYNLRYKLIDNQKESDTQEVTIIIRNNWKDSVLTWAAYLLQALIVGSLIYLLIRKRRQGQRQSSQIAQTSAITNRNAASSAPQPQNTSPRLPATTEVAPEQESIPEEAAQTAPTEPVQEKLDMDMLSARDKKLLDKILKVVEDNLNNPHLSIDLLCDEVGISRAHIYRKLKELTNQGGHEFIKNARLNKAKELLLEGSLSIAEIAEKVGITSSSNLSSSFKEKFGLPPLQWREANRKRRHS